MGCSRKLKGYETDEHWRVYDAGLMFSMVRIAVPSIIQQSIVQIGILLVQSVVNSFGASVLAGYSAGMRIESISIVPMLAMGNAMSTFTAQNVGAGQLERVNKGYRMCHEAVLSAGGISVYSLSVVWECVRLSVFGRRKWKRRFSDGAGLCEVSFVLLLFYRAESIHRRTSARGRGCEGFYSG